MTERDELTEEEMTLFGEFGVALHAMHALKPYLSAATYAAVEREVDGSLDQLEEAARKPKPVREVPGCVF